MELVTIPSMDRLEVQAATTPDYMRPTKLPTAAVAKGFLSPRNCEHIITYMERQPAYEFNHCDAVTREAPRPLDKILDPAVRCAQVMNEMFWGFDLDEFPGAFMQTYEQGGSYQRHVDGSPGQMRKLTAVVMLTDQMEYAGGQLHVVIEPGSAPVTKLQGSIAVFPAWVAHWVDPVNFGVRQTLNLGFWGPPFK